LSGDFRADLDLRSFPFDIQNVDVEFGSLSFPIAQVRLVADNDNEENKETSSGTDQEWIILEKYIVDSAAKKDGELYSQASLKLKIKIKRNPSYYITKVILPLLILFLVSTSQFWLRWDRLDARVSIVLTALVAVVAYQFIIEGNLPKLPYLTVLDQIILTTFPLAWLVIVGAMSITPITLWINAG